MLCLELRNSYDVDQTGFSMLRLKYVAQRIFLHQKVLIFSNFSAKRYFFRGVRAYASMKPCLLRELNVIVQKSELSALLYSPQEPQLWVLAQC